MQLPAHLLELFTEAEGLEAVPAGAVIFAAGDAAVDMFLLLEGAVEIHINDALVSRLEGGSVFGEMALIDARERSGTAQALVASRLLRISAKQFRFLVKHVPEFAEFMLQLVSSRLRDTVSRSQAEALQ